MFARITHRLIIVVLTTLYELMIAVLIIDVVVVIIALITNVLIIAVFVRYIGTIPVFFFNGCVDDSSIVCS